MRKFKFAGMLLSTLILGFLAGMFTYEQWSLDVTRKLEDKIHEYESIKVEIEAVDNFYDNLEAFNKISILEHAENNNAIKIKELLVPKLIHRYRLALEWSKLETENETYRELNAEIIKKIDELAKDSDLFKEISESGKKDS